MKTGNTGVGANAGSWQTFVSGSGIDSTFSMEDGEPVGGQWSFDEENRKKTPAS